MANQGFNRGSSGAGRRRSLALMPGESSGEGTTGNKIPRGTTLASVRRGQALLRMMNDRLPNGQDFSRGTTRAGRRRNFALIAGIQAGTTVTLELNVDPFSYVGPSVQIEWTDEISDPDNWWTSGATITCATTGTYTVEYSFDIAESSPGGGGFVLRKNGIEVDNTAYSAGATSFSKTLSVAMTAGDTIVLDVYATTSATFSNGVIQISS
jgi:hypothetical protein